jgi:hypothetical protein
MASSVCTGLSLQPQSTVPQTSQQSKWVGNVLRPLQYDQLFSMGFWPWFGWFLGEWFLSLGESQSYWRNEPTATTPIRPDSRPLPSGQARRERLPCAPGHHQDGASFVFNGRSEKPIQATAKPNTTVPSKPTSGEEDISKSEPNWWGDHYHQPICAGSEPALDVGIAGTTDNLPRLSRGYLWLQIA